MSKVVICEVRSREKTTKNKPKKKVQWLAMKWNGLWWTPFDVEWKNAAHLVDRMANWCIGGCWFILAVCLLVFNRFCQKRGGALKKIDFLGWFWSWLLDIEVCISCSYCLWFYFILFNLMKWPSSICLHTKRLISIQPKKTSTHLCYGRK